jgi:hypothetical protein
VAGNSQSEIPSSILDLGLDFDPLIDFAFDPTLSADELSLEGIGSFEQVTGLESDLFLDNDNDLNLTPDSNTNWFLADNFDSHSTSFLANNLPCDVGNVEYNQLVKVRREALCPAPPTGQVEPPDEPNEDEPYNNDSFNLDQFFTTNQVTVFPENLEVCPPDLFIRSNIPVCYRLSEQVLVLASGGLVWFNLYGVVPRTFSVAIPLCLVIQHLLNVPA